jgi:uncharacterized coiled-coil protein SlyX
MTDNDNGDSEILFLLKELKESVTETRHAVDALRREIKLIPPRLDTLAAEVTMAQERLHKNNNLLAPLVYELDQLVGERRFREKEQTTLEARVRHLSNQVADQDHQDHQDPEKETP